MRPGQWRRRLLQAALVAAMMAVTATAARRETVHKEVVEAEEKQKPMVTAVIVFGDSIMDPGNNNDLHTVVKANHPPYGKDFAGHVPTGRFSNGLIPTDFIGTYLES